MQRSLGMAQEGSSLSEEECGQTLQKQRRHFSPDEAVNSLINLAVTVESDIVDRLNHEFVQ